MSALVWVGLFGSIATLTRLIVSGLWRRYLWFTALDISFLIKCVLILYGTTFLGNSSSIYVSLWQWCHATISLTLIGAGIETYCHIANDYPRIGDYGRRVLAYSSLAALVLALLPLSADTIMDLLRTGTFRIGVLSRSSAIAVGLGLAFAITHIRSVPIPERRNLLHHRWLMMAYCVGQAVGMTMLVLTSNRAWALIYMGTSAICWCLWPFLLTAKGEWLERRVFSEGDRLNIEAAVGEFRTFVEQTSEQVARSRARR